MNAQSVNSLLDLSPALHVMLMGLVVALGPLSWVWLRNRQAEPGRRMQALVLLTLFLSFDLVVFGAFTRLTDSGLGCPDWPGCYGHASPIGAQANITAAQTAVPSGPVTHSKAWIEMIHRYLATAVGVLILTLTLASWWPQRPLGETPSADRVNPWWATASLLWVCVQGAFGALTVTMKLFPAIVTLHLLGGVLLLALLCAQAVASRRQVTDVVTVPPSLRLGLWLVLALVLLQTALGGWVSTNYAVLACSDFPQCQGAWWPPMDLSQGFELWRPLGMSASGAMLNFAALTGIHYVHRIAAVVVLLALALLAARLQHQPGLRQQSRWLGAVALAQLASGVSNVVLGWPLFAALAHTAGAAALTVILVWALCTSRPAAFSAVRQHGHSGVHA